MKSLARPEGNIIGVHFQQVEATAKRLELMGKLLPAARRIAVLSDCNTADQLTAARAAAKVPGLELHVIELGTPPLDMTRVMDGAQAARAQGLLVLTSPTFFGQRDSLLREASKRDLAVVAGMAQIAEASAIVSYGTSIDAMFARSADNVGKIIKGESGRRTCRWSSRPPSNSSLTSRPPGHLASRCPMRSCFRRLMWLSSLRSDPQARSRQ